MYEKFYGFREKPFQMVPNPAFLYKSPKHETALTYLEYGVAENVGFILLTGEIGSGKTTLVQYLLGRMDKSIEAAVVFNTTVTAEELFGMIMEEFNLPRAAGDKASNLNALNQFLIDRYARRKRVLLIIDEAQNLSDPALEEVRMLSNLQSDDQNLLQIILVGQPELASKLKKPALRQFGQRIAASYHLVALDRNETGEYVACRLQKAGGRTDLFTPAALDLVFELSGGVPRAINLACQAALVYGFAEGAQRISQDIIRQIRGDNLGIGLLTVEPPPAVVPEAPAGNGFERRMQVLEAGVKDIHKTMMRCTEALENKTQPPDGEQVAQLIALLRKERREREELLLKVGRLEAENKNLRRAGSWLKAKLKGE
jgi:putative secretion ATPase (PEP-CTERM system associated)